MALTIGSLNRQVKLIKNRAVSDGQGGGDDRSGSVDIWASVEKISGARSMQAGQPANTKGYKMLTLKLMNLTIEEGDQIQDGDKLITLSLVEEHPENNRFLRMEGSAR